MVNDLSKFTINVFFTEILDTLHHIDTRLASKFTPLQLVAGTAVTVIACEKIKDFYHDDRSITETLGNWALRIPPIREKYEKDIQKQREHFQTKFKADWELSGPLITKIPEKGWSPKQALELIEKYQALTLQDLKNKHFSGTIYPKGLEQETSSLTEIIKKQISSYPEQENLDLAQLEELVSNFCTLISNIADLWNPLHSGEFKVGTKIERQLVLMYADLFGGTDQEVMGFVTKGGTESLIKAAKIYHKRGMEERGLKREEAVIIAPDTMHAALLKAKEDFGFKLVLIQTDETGQMEMDQFHDKIIEHRDELVALFGSAPCYPTGKIDPIKQMAETADKMGCGMHVDCCLGAFAINARKDLNTQFLAMKGVTSISLDPHKNGLARKGVSVLITKKIAGDNYNLALYGLYVYPFWKGGPYTTAGTAGSYSITAAFQALITTLLIGRENYNTMGQTIYEKAQALASIIQSCKDLKLLGEPEVNVVTFTLDKNMVDHNRQPLLKGAPYAFADAMKKQNFVLNEIEGGAVHFCLTGRFIGDPEGIEKFKEAALASLNDIKEQNARLIQEGKKEFPGSAKIYGGLASAKNPSKEELGIKKYCNNLLFGSQAAYDTVSSYVLAQLNPYSKFE